MSDFLVVDFDYFFVNPIDGGDYTDPHAPLYDWGHVENDLHTGPLWTPRLMAFERAGVPLPYATEPSEGWAAWWSRFWISPDAPLRVCDSNGWAGLVRPDGGGPFESVWLYDAHHDAGYRPDAWPPGETFQCDTWMLQHAEAGTEPEALHVRYPTWKIHAFGAEPRPPLPIDRAFDDDSTPEAGFDAVLLCRSGAWVPPWCDDQFAAFAEAYPGEVEQIDDSPRVRPFDVAAELASAHEINALLAQMMTDPPV